MANPTNQEIERYYFEQFKAHYPVPEGTVEYADKPDVVIHGNKIIGIEIANLYLSSGTEPSSEQVQRIRRVCAIQRAQDLHISLGGRPIECWFGFEPTQPISSIDHVALGIARLMADVQSFISEELPRHLFANVPELRFVYSNGNEYSDAKWRPVQSYTVPFLSDERVRSLVVEKTDKLKGYRPCDGYWLLLVVDFMDPAQDQDIRWPAGATRQQSPFERVFIYKLQFGEVTEVPQ